MNWLQRTSSLPPTGQNANLLVELARSRVSLDKVKPRISQADCGDIFDLLSMPEFQGNSALLDLQQTFCGETAKQMPMDPMNMEPEGQMPYGTVYPESSQGEN